MSIYHTEPLTLTEEAVVVRIFNGQEAPVAMLHRAGPVTEGADYLYVPEGAFPVPAQLLLGAKISQRTGRPLFIRLEEVAWDEQWGEIAANQPSNVIVEIKPEAENYWVEWVKGGEHGRLGPFIDPEVAEKVQAAKLLELSANSISIEEAISK